MADYSSKTVAQLKIVLKERGIHLPNNTRKQQIIDRLIEEDEKAGTEHVEDGKASNEEDEVASADATVIDAEGERKDGSASSKEHPPTEDGLAPPTPDENAISTTSSVTLQADTESPEQAAPTQEMLASQDPIPSREEPPPTVTATPNLSEAPSTDLSRVNTIELAEDSKKRKRRSATPPVDSQVVAKKLKQDAVEDVVHLKEDIVSESQETAAETQKDVEMGEPNMENGPTKTVLPMSTSDDVMDVVESQEVVISGDGRKVKDADANLKTPIPGKQPQLVEDKPTDRDPSMDALNERKSTPRSDRKSPGTPRKHNTLPKDARYKDLFAPTDAASRQAKEKTPIMDNLPEAAPSIYPATRALYVRNFMRPLQPQALKRHLIDIASPHPDNPDPEILESFFVDFIRTHALILFTSITAATRVRNALHEQVWPAERDRKPLWADFIPVEKIDTWVSVEEEANGSSSRINSKRWEVVYEKNDEGVLEAFLQEADTSSASFQPPTGPARQMSRRESTRSNMPPPIGPIRKAPPAQAFVALDELFKSTSQSRPKLYYQPVPKDLAERRLDELDRWSSRNFRGGRGRTLEEMHRYTFEDGDKLVDGGMQRPRGDGAYRGGGGFRGSGRWRR